VVLAEGRNRVSKAKAVRRILLIVLALGVVAVAFRGIFRRPAAALVQRVKGRATVEERLQQFGVAARSRMAPDFQRIALSYPPKQVTLVGLKQEKRLEIWVSGAAGTSRCLKTYPILGASGDLGPKLRQGDNQVPEGVYRIESLNPNSLYHVALRVNYPNEFDKAKGALDGRRNLGGDIMIHGKSCSIGCLAMGDAAAEELFCLAADAGLQNITVILSPVDLRVRKLSAEMPKVPPWAPQLYDTVTSALSALTEDKALSGPSVTALWQKVELDLQSIDRDGLRGPADGRAAVSYEFAIPNTDDCKAEVRAIDPTVKFMPGSQGRIRAPQTGCLCIGSTHQAGYRDVLRKLAELPYVERIIECHFE
jgi:hypothetical protein